MLELSVIRAAPDRVRQALRDRGWSDVRVVDDALQQDQERRSCLTKAQHAQAEAKRGSKEIGALMRRKDRDGVEELKAQVAEHKAQAAEWNAQAQVAGDNLSDLLLTIPNIPHASVPVGRSEKDNRVLYEWGTQPTMDFASRPHWELAETHGLIDFQRGAKVAGAGFPCYVGRGAQLQRALIQYFLTHSIRAGYLEVQPPLLVNEVSARGTGQLPDKEGQMYHIGGDGLYLVPTAEVPVTNLYRDEIFREADLPIKLCAYTPCWRREAGSYGRAVRGLNRIHQFDKVEIVEITTPAESHATLDAMVTHVEQMLVRLGLHYRKLLMCTGDMGFNQTKQYDLEVWAAAQERWLEVSSISNFETYQSERMQIRYRPKAGGRNQLVHTLNGSALALPRIVAALLENNQREDGSVVLPPVVGQFAGTEVPWVIA